MTPGAYYWIEGIPEKNGDREFRGVWKYEVLSESGLHYGQCFWEGFHPIGGLLWSDEIVREATPEEIMRAIL